MIAFKGVCNQIQIISQSHDFNLFNSSLFFGVWICLESGERLYSIHVSDVRALLILEDWMRVSIWWSFAAFLDSFAHKKHQRWRQICPPLMDNVRRLGGGAGANLSIQVRSWGSCMPFLDYRREPYGIADSEGRSLWPWSVFVGPIANVSGLVSTMILFERTRSAGFSVNTSSSWTTP